MSELETAIGQSAVAAERPAFHMSGWATFILFVLGILAGVALNSYISPPPPTNPYAELSQVGEPPESAAIVKVLLADDARTLSRMLPGDVLQGLGKAIDPLAEVFEAKFVGGTERKGDILASYVMSGRGNAGQSFSVGVVFRVSGGKVIGVN